MTTTENVKPPLCSRCGNRMLVAFIVPHRPGGSGVRTSAHSAARSKPSKSQSDMRGYEIDHPNRLSASSYEAASDRALNSTNTVLHRRINVAQAH
jgi:hypothetical protein